MSHFLGEQICLAPRMGWINRHLDGMPKETCKIKIQTTDAGNLQGVRNCTWEPFRKEEWTQEQMPANGYLGTAHELTIGKEGMQISIGYHAWENHNSEFVYYQLIEEKNT